MIYDNSRALHTETFWTLLFLAVRRHSHCTSAPNWESKAWKFSHTACKFYVRALTYVPCRVLLQQYSVWKWDHQKSNAYLCLTFGWEWSGHGQTSQTGSSAYGKLWRNPNHTSCPMLRRYGSPSREAGYDWPVYLEERDTICSRIKYHW